MPNRIRRPRAEWRKLIAEHRASGLSAVDFAQRRGLCVNTLRWW